MLYGIGGEKTNGIDGSGLKAGIMHWGVSKL
jgi:hypothetical protein